MNRISIDIIAGARPNFMKVAPIIKAIELAQSSGSSLNYRLIHTGQHYDANMSESFFEQLGIPKPEINLEVGSGTQAEQSAEIMIRYEKVLLEQSSDLCLVVGDVSSTMACSIVAQKMGVPVAHVEAGIRSGDWTMPEEINRLVTDAITNYFFTTSESAGKILRAGGVKKEQIFFVGNTMIDTLLANMDRFKAPEFFKNLSLQKGNYFVLTLHRPANVDKGSSFEKTLLAVSEATRNLPVIFPVHPRSLKTLSALPHLPENIHLVDPQPYLEFNYLVKHAKAVITDSGGITEEATVMGIPCLTLRNNTERPETIDIGTNELIGTDPSKLKPALNKVFSEEWKKGNIPKKWDGKTGQRIVEKLEELLVAKNV